MGPEASSDQGSGKAADRSPLGLRFYPEYLLEVLVVITLVLEGVLALALLVPAILGRRIDLVGPFVPRPEWYFLWLYELVKYFPGSTAVIGAVVIPLAMLGILALVPWIDPAGERRWLVRWLWAGMVLAAAVLTALSFRA